MLKTILIFMAILSTPLAFACDEYYATGDTVVCYDDYSSEEKLNNALMIEFIKSTAIGMALQAALERFVRDVQDLNERDTEAFRQIFRAEKQRQERAERERQEREDRHGAPSHEWGGHMDNNCTGNCSRAGMGA